MQIGRPKLLGRPKILGHPSFGVRSNFFGRPEPVDIQICLGVPNVWASTMLGRPHFLDVHHFFGHPKFFWDAQKLLDAQTFLDIRNFLDVQFASAKLAAGPGSRRAEMVGESR